MCISSIPEPILGSSVPPVVSRELGLHPLCVMDAPLGGGLLLLLCPGVVSLCCGCDDNCRFEAAQWIRMSEGLCCIFYLN